MKLYFGHCEQYAIIETEDNSIVSIGFIEPPVHQPGVFDVKQLRTMKVLQASQQNELNEYLS